MVKVALSPVSEENAIANMDAEVAGFDFDKVHAAAQRAAWEKEFARIDIKASPEMEKNLYTAVYHALQSPNLSMDVDGSYRGPDNQVHKAEGFHFVSNLSLWDTFRAEQPLMTILEPESEDERSGEFAAGFAAGESVRHSADLAGAGNRDLVHDRIPRGAGDRGCDDEGHRRVRSRGGTACHGGERHAMVRTEVSTTTCGSAMCRSITTTRPLRRPSSMPMTTGRSRGWLQQLKHRDVAETFTKRAADWRNNFNVKDGFVEPRLANGDYRVPFDPAKAGKGSGFTEGNSWQYSWFQPQDEQGLIQLLGGDAQLIAKLDAMFDAKVDPHQYADVEDISGMIGQYIHGNEPSHHLAYLYVYANAPARTQERLKQIVDSQYRPTPDGLVGNDDLGQMSAWLLFTAMGFYPVAPGSNQYVIGRPFVDEATLHLPNGKTFKIVAESLSDANAYVQSVELNGHAAGAVVYPS